MLKSIPLANLVASDRNVRRASDPLADAQLAADIAAHGLLQNLVVTPARPRGTYAVEAGGRRLAALNALQAEGVLPEGHAVPCLVLGTNGRDAAGATEASLAENLQRLAMNPADECLAFGKLVEAGVEVDGIARRFGLTVRHVEGRLRLAGLHPVVFEALGAGEITLDAAKAYAATPDRERQLWVFEQLHASWSGAHPDSIRRMMVSATVPATDRRLRFVGHDAYLAAGGRLEQDLFGDDADARVLDVALLDQLAADKLEVEAAWFANEHGYAFVRASLDSYVQPWRHDDLRRARIDLPAPGEEERIEIAEIEAEIETHVAVLETGDEDADDADGHTGDAAHAKAAASIADLEARLCAIAGRPPVLAPEIRGTVGFFLLIDEDGVPRLDRTPYERVDETDDPDERSGVLSTALSYLALYRDPSVAATTSACDWRIADLLEGSRPVSLYLVVPPSDISRTRPLIRLVLNQIGRRLTERRLLDRPGQRQLLLMLDEFPALGRLDFFETTLAFMAGYGVRAFLIAQSLNQIVKAYGENNAILDNCHVRIAFASNDERTARRISDALGTATEQRAMRNYAGHRLAPWLAHVMVSRQETARPLLTPGEVMQLDARQALVLVSGVPPIRAEKLRYFEDRTFAGRCLPAPEIVSGPWADRPAPRGHDWTVTCPPEEVAPNVEPATGDAGGSMQRAREPEPRSTRKKMAPDPRQPELTGFEDAVDLAADAAMMKPVAAAYAVEPVQDREGGNAAGHALGFAA